MTDELKQTILSYLFSKNSATVKETGTNLLSLLRQRQVVPNVPINITNIAHDSSKSLSIDQIKDMGHQLVQNIERALEMHRTGNAYSIGSPNANALSIFCSS